uniref:Uncharacterized protein n=1 Tax=Megaselia scalaris TaxID=36166 RepID=T1GFG7_MEGSC
MDKFYLRFKSKRKFDLKDTKNTEILYDSGEKVYSCVFPCIPEDSKSSEAIVNISSLEKGSLERNEDNDLCKTQFEVLKLKRITENCKLRIDGGVPVQIESHFPFGFGSSYDEESFSMQTSLQRVQCLVKKIVLEMSVLSKIQQYERVVDTKKHISQVVVGAAVGLYLLKVTYPWISSGFSKTKKKPDSECDPSSQTEENSEEEIKVQKAEQLLAELNETKAKKRQPNLNAEFLQQMRKLVNIMIPRVFCYETGILT